MDCQLTFILWAPRAFIRRLSEFWLWEKISRKERSKRTDRLLDVVGNFLILTSGEFDTMKLYVLELRTLLRMMLVARFSRRRAK